MQSSMQSSTQSSVRHADPAHCRIASGVRSLTLFLIMASTPPASASELFWRAAKCQRLMARLALVAAIIMTIIMAKSGTEFIRNSTTGNAGGAERITGHLTYFVALLVLQLTFLFLARRRSSAAHHASVKSNNLKALELLAASAPDEATKKDLHARAADLVAGKPGCCK